MRQNEISLAPGSTHPRKRVGRGLGSGHGRYSGRGVKGQKARSGGKLPPYFEGGQLPLVKRLPRKRGFTNIFKTEYSIVNVGRLNIFEPNSMVNREELWRRRLIDSVKKPVKILGEGSIDRPLVVVADKFSASAREKVRAAGGTVEEGNAAKAS